jgi:PTS system beta-glucosides-specific IIC component
MLGKLKDLLRGHKEGVAIFSPLEGEAVPLSEVNDPAFSGEMLGEGIAIKPSGGRVVAPLEGTVSVMFETGHAVVITSNEGVEILIHLGLDTVKLKGEHFTRHAATGDKVKAGDLLLEFDREKIISCGYDVITPVIITNTDDCESVDADIVGEVRELDRIMTVHK